MTRVIKIGGRAQRDPRLAASLASACRDDGRLCVVHGGGDEVTALQRRLGGEPSFVDGRRVTTDEDLAIVRMVLSGTINKRIVGALLAQGVPAAGVSGEDGDLLRCATLGDGSLGAVGVPESVRPALLEALFAGGFVPVVSPLGRLAADGRGCNVNGDDAAAAIAAALGAGELVLVADVAGVLDADGHWLPALDLVALASLIDRGVARGGMVAKLEAARRAVLAGVARVRIGDFLTITDSSAGTLVTSSPTLSRLAV